MSLGLRRGNSTTIFALTIADMSAPTVAELEAGVDLGLSVAALNGFETSQSRIQQPVQKRRAAVQIPGVEEFPDASIVLVEDDGVGTDADAVERRAAETAMVEGASGYVVLLRWATEPTAAKKCDVYKVTLGAVNPSWSLDAEPARSTVNTFVEAYQKKATIAAGA